MMERRTESTTALGASAGPGWRDRESARPLELAILDGLGEPLIAIDDAWRITHWNAGAERLTGCSRESMIGTDFRATELLAADRQLASVHDDVMRARTARSIRGWMAHQRTSDGRASDVHASAHDVRVSPLPNGGAVALFIDVGDRAARDREMAERMAENDALRRLAGQMAAVPDSAALLQLLCEAACDQSGASGASVLRVEGDSCRFVGTVGTLEGVQSRTMPIAGSFTERLLAARDDRLDAIAIDAYRSDSPSFNALADRLGIGPMIVTPLQDHGELLGVLSVCRLRGSAAFSERERARVRVIADHASLVLRKSDLLEQAQAANAAKVRFLATVSHELRTPLTALGGYEELLADGVFGTLNDDQRDAIERMRGVTEQLKAMIDEILDFTALDAGRDKVALRPVCSADVLESANLVLKPLAERRRLRYELSLPEDPPRIVTDPDKARQILVNLGNNAIKFTDEGAVTLTLLPQGDRVRFEVRDTGIGIPRPAIPTLFRPFSQLDTGLTRRHGGTGLGLYIARRLAEMLCGHIEVSSEPGKGSTFSLVLPADQV